MSHTKGLAEVKELPCSKGGTMKFLLVSGTGIAVMCGKVGGAKVEEGNARRLLALWNMAEELGLTTEAIEKGVIQDSYHALADHLVEEIVSGKIQRLEAEKAEMLAILEELRESSTCCGTYDLLEETTWASPDLVDRIEAAIRKARGEE